MSINLPQAREIKQVVCTHGFVESDIPVGEADAIAAAAGVKAKSWPNSQVAFLYTDEMTAEQRVKFDEAVATEEDRLANAKTE